MGIGSSSPSDFLISARSAAEVSMETIWLTGSPTKRNIENEMIPTAIMTPIAWMARRSVKASICSFHFFFTTRRTPLSGPLFLLRGPVEQNLIIGALGYFHFFRNAPCQRLLMHRD